MARLKALPGVSDILPEEAVAWQRCEAEARSLFRLYGFQEVRIPILEEADLFYRSLGAQAEVVNKQMYEFTDRGNRRVALRPEGTAPVVRAFLERGLDTTGGLTRWYYLGPMFRAERPQAGRRRQFHQIGVEVFGSKAPHQDAEVIELLQNLLIRLGIQGFQLKLNSLGCRKDRSRIVTQIKEAFADCRDRLCEDCKHRYEQNPLRILDCKEPECISQKNRVDVARFVCESCRSHFEEVLAALQAADLKKGSDYSVDPSLVRGLDYYTKTAFEVTHPSLGAQNALGGGGRYDDLVETLGGVSTPAVGFAIGLERVLMVLQKQPAPEAKESSQVFVAALGKESLEEGFRLLSRLRQAGVSCVADYEARPLKKQLDVANKLGVKLVAILGSAELARGIATLKRMDSGEQVEVPLSECIAKIGDVLKGDTPRWK